MDENANALSSSLRTMINYKSCGGVKGVFGSNTAEVGNIHFGGRHHKPTVKRSTYKVNYD